MYDFIQCISFTKFETLPINYSHAKKQPAPDIKYGIDYQTNQADKIL